MSGSTNFACLIKLVTVARLVTFSFSYGTLTVGTRQCDCSATQSFGADVANGVFKSPGFPNGYCDHLKCTYEIEPRQNEAVVLVLEFFDTEPQHDYAEIHQMFRAENTYHYAKQEVLSGQVTNRRFYSSMYGGFRVILVTDSSESNFAGFRMSFFRFNQASQRHFPCPMPFLRATDAAVAMPITPAKFPADASCVFLINSTEAVKVVVKSVLQRVILKMYETENFISRPAPESLQTFNGYANLSYPQTVLSRTESLTVVVSFSSQPVCCADPYKIEVQKTASICKCPADSITLYKGKTTELISPGFPFEYCDSANCTTSLTMASYTPVDTTITPVVRVCINTFNLEIDVDYLSMMDVKPLIRLSNTARDMKYFTFDQTSVALNFVTDHSIVEKGFNVSLDIYEKPYYCQCPGHPQIMQKTKDGQKHAFDEKCLYMDCFWEIRQPEAEGSYRVVLKVNFMLRGEGEFIEISNGENLERNDERLRLDYRMIPEVDLAERSIEFDGFPYVSIWYHRDGDNVSGLRTLNFEYEWRKKCQCGQSLFQADTDDWKVLTSPDYPVPYCNLLDCRWLIEAPEGHYIALNITDFFTEANQDYLTIFDGNQTDGAHIEMLSGLESLSTPVASTLNKMTLLFRSDVSLSMRGFTLHYKAEPTEEYKARLEASSRAGPWAVVLFGFFIFIAAGTLIFFAQRTGRFQPNFDVFRMRMPFNRFFHNDREESLWNPVYRAN
ncbi:Protein F38B2.3 [Aphelenchoides avenae]|nr:Protein F38B2.3 [Aphelenchus avenae]